LKNNHHILTNVGKNRHIRQKGIVKFFIRVYNWRNNIILVLFFLIIWIGGDGMDSDPGGSSHYNSIIILLKGLFALPFHLFYVKYY